MCGSGDHDHHGGDVVQSMPRPVEGEAVDAIGLEPVDEVMITTLVDNSFDALLADAGPVRRARRSRSGYGQSDGSRNRCRTRTRTGWRDGVRARRSISLGGGLI